MLNRNDTLSVKRRLQETPIRTPICANYINHFNSANIVTPDSQNLLDILDYIKKDENKYIDTYWSSCNKKTCLSSKVVSLQNFKCLQELKLQFGTLTTNQKISDLNNKLRSCDINCGESSLDKILKDPVFQDKSYLTKSACLSYYSEIAHKKNVALVSRSSLNKVYSELHTSNLGSRAVYLKNIYISNNVEVRENKKVTLFMKPVKTMHIPLSLPKPKDSIEKNIRNPSFLKLLSHWEMLGNTLYEESYMWFTSCQKHIVTLCLLQFFLVIMNFTRQENLMLIFRSLTCSDTHSLSLKSLLGFYRFCIRFYCFIFTDIPFGDSKETVPQMHMLLQGLLSHSVSRLACLSDLFYLLTDRNTIFTKTHYNHSLVYRVIDLICNVLNNIEFPLDRTILGYSSHNSKNSCKRFFINDRIISNRSFVYVNNELVDLHPILADILLNQFIPKLITALKIPEHQSLILSIFTQELYWILDFIFSDIYNPLYIYNCAIHKRSDILKKIPNIVCSIFGLFSKLLINKGADSAVSSMVKFDMLDVTSVLMNNQHTITMIQDIFHIKAFNHSVMINNSFSEFWYGLYDWFYINEASFNILLSLEERKRFLIYILTQIVHLTLAISNSLRSKSRLERKLKRSFKKMLPLLLPVFFLWFSLFLSELKEKSVESIKFIEFMISSFRSIASEHSKLIDLSFLAIMHVNPVFKISDLMNSYSWFLLNINDMSIVDVKHLIFSFDSDRLLESSNNDLRMFMIMKYVKDNLMESISFLRLPYNQLKLIQNNNLNDLPNCFPVFKFERSYNLSSNDKIEILLLYASCIAPLYNKYIHQIDSPTIHSSVEVTDITESKKYKSCIYKRTPCNNLLYKSSVTLSSEFLNNSFSDTNHQFFNLLTSLSSQTRLPSKKCLPFNNHATPKNDSYNIYSESSSSFSSKKKCNHGLLNSFPMLCCCYVWLWGIIATIAKEKLTDVTAKPTSEKNCIQLNNTNGEFLLTTPNSFETLSSFDFNVIEDMNVEQSLLSSFFLQRNMFNSTQNKKKIDTFQTGDLVFDNNWMFGIQSVGRYKQKSDGMLKQPLKKRNSNEFKYQTGFTFPIHYIPPNIAFHCVSSLYQAVSKGYSLSKMIQTVEIQETLDGPTEKYYGLYISATVGCPCYSLHRIFLRSDLHFIKPKATVSPIFILLSKSPEMAFNVLLLNIVVVFCVCMRSFPWNIGVDIPSSSYYDLELKAHYKKCQDIPKNRWIAHIKPASINSLKSLTFNEFRGTCWFETKDWNFCKRNLFIQLLGLLKEETCSNLVLTEEFFLRGLLTYRSFVMLIITQMIRTQTLFEKPEIIYSLVLLSKKLEILFMLRLQSCFLSSESFSTIVKTVSNDILSSLPFIEMLSSFQSIKNKTFVTFLQQPYSPENVSIFFISILLLLQSIHALIFNNNNKNAKSNKMYHSVFSNITSICFALLPSLNSEQKNFFSSSIYSSKSSEISGVNNRESSRNLHQLSTQKNHSANTVHTPESSRVSTKVGKSERSRDKTQRLNPKYLTPSCYTQNSQYNSNQTNPIIKTDSFDDISLIKADVLCFQSTTSHSCNDCKKIVTIQLVILAIQVALSCCSRDELSNFIAKIFSRLCLLSSQYTKIYIISVMSTIFETIFSKLWLKPSYISYIADEIISSVTLALLSVTDIVGTAYHSSLIDFSSLKLSRCTAVVDFSIIVKQLPLNTLYNLMKLLSLRFGIQRLYISGFILLMYKEFDNLSSKIIELNWEDIPPIAFVDYVKFIVYHTKLSSPAYKDLWEYCYNDMKSLSIDFFAFIQNMLKNKHEFSKTDTLSLSVFIEFLIFYFKSFQSWFEQNNQLKEVSLTPYYNPYFDDPQSTTVVNKCYELFPSLIPFANSLNNFFHDCHNNTNRSDKSILKLFNHNNTSMKNHFIDRPDKKKNSLHRDLPSKNNSVNKKKTQSTDSSSSWQDSTASDESNPKEELTDESLDSSDSFNWIVIDEEVNTEVKWNALSTVSPELLKVFSVSKNNKKRYRIKKKIIHSALINTKIPENWETFITSMFRSHIPLAEKSNF